MSISAVVFVVVYFGGLLMAFRNPSWGLCSYLWAFYNYPPSRWWGSEVPDLRWSLIAAIVTLVALALHTATQDGGAVESPAQTPSSSQPTRKHGVGVMQPHAPGGSASRSGDDAGLGPGFWLLTAFAIWIWIGSAWAVDPAEHFEGAVLFTKYVVLLFLIDRLIRQEWQLELFSWAHVGGCFLWGWLAYGSNVVTRAEIEMGPGVGDSNTLGFHLVTGLAFAGFMLLCLSGRRRLALLGLIPFILNGIILTSSRGAIVALAAAGGAALFFPPQKRLGTMLGAGALGVVLFALLAQSAPFWERMGTLNVFGAEQEIEGSAMSRIAIAEANWRMFQDYPMGAGYRGDVTLSPRYMPEELLTNGRRSAHNTFLAVLVNTGIPGFCLFVAWLAWASWRLWASRRVEGRPLSPSLGGYRAAVASSLAAYVVAGMFGNFLIEEVGVWLVALVPVLARLGATESHGPKDVVTVPVTQVPAWTRKTA